MLPLDLNNIISLLREFAHTKKIKLDIILIGGLAISYYGMKDRATLDIDAEIRGNVDSLSKFLKARNIPSNIGEDISRWSVISIPPGYRKRAEAIYKDELLTIKVLSPVDFIITKLRRFSEEDLNDALFIAKKFNLTAKEVQNMADKAIKISPKDTTLFLFKKNVELFIKKMKALKLHNSQK